MLVVGLSGLIRLSGPVLIRGRGRLLIITIATPLCSIESYLRAGAGCLKLIACDVVSRDTVVDPDFVSIILSLKVSEFWFFKLFR